MATSQTNSSATVPVAQIDSKHEDMIHDSQFDYYAKKLATCSSDRTIKIFDAVNGHELATLTSHEGPVWQVAWAHPKFGTLLASCSYDGAVIIHKQHDSGQAANSWSKIYEHKRHKSSVNSISWAPHEHGLRLACASSDGSVSVLQYREDRGQWISIDVTNNDNISLGYNAVSWAPDGSLGSIRNTEHDQSQYLRLVTGSCDNCVRIWKCKISNDNFHNWEPEIIPTQPHLDWVRDVAWAPSSAMPYNIIASCSEDRKVFIWKQTTIDGPWEPTLLKEFEAPVWRVSWSITGNVLAVSTGDHRVTLWKQSVDESWLQITTVDDM